MRLFIPEPKIDIGKDGFVGIDTLDRKPFGDQMSALLSALEDPVVVAIDGGWGSGKTVFLKLWVGEHLKREGNKDRVIYFDAFRHDYLDDPLIALVSEIETDQNAKKGKLPKLKKAAAALARPAFRIGLSLATAGVTEAAGAIGDAAARASEKELARTAETFWKKEDSRRAAMKAFREALTDLAESQDGGKLIIVVDELDRCRPDYALSVLETIKHFFAVDNVHFVLGVNLAELKNTVRARYGMGTAADAYLDKFIHLRMALPNRAGPRPQDMAGMVHFESIAEEMGIPAKIYGDTYRYLELRETPLSLREAERVASLVALVAPSLENVVAGYRLVILGAAVLKGLDPEIYAKLLHGTTTFREVTRKLFIVDERHRLSVGSRFAIYCSAAWAGFMDQAAWEASEVQAKQSLFHFNAPLEQPYNLSKTITEFLETFQFPARAQ